MIEIWKKIPGYSHYMVSNLGRVRSLDRELTQSRGGKYQTIYTKSIKGKTLRPGKNTKHGHVTVSLGRHNSINVHRLVMRAFVGPCPKNKEVLHKNGKAGDNRLYNLRYGTRSENNIDISKMGRRKFTSNDIKYIRQCEWQGVDLANEFGVAQSTISAVRLRKLYAWID